MTAAAIEMQESTRRGPGKPPKFTPERATKILEHLCQGLHYEPAANLAGASYRAYRDWFVASEGGDPAYIIPVPDCLRDAPDDSGPQYAQFAQLVQASEAYWEQWHVRNVNEGSKLAPALSLKALARRHPERWADQSRVQHQHSGTVTQVITLALPTPQQMDQLGHLLGLPDASIDGTYETLEGEPELAPGT